VVADHGPLGARLPPEALAPGDLGVMAHSRVAVDATLRFTVAELRGEGRLEDQSHAVPAGDLARAFGNPAEVAGALQGGQGGAPGFLPCGGP
jgi:hypothetical protein